MIANFDIADKIISVWLPMVLAGAVRIYVGFLIGHIRNRKRRQFLKSL